MEYGIGSGGNARRQQSQPERKLQPTNAGLPDLLDKHDHERRSRPLRSGHVWTRSDHVSEVRTGSVESSFSCDTGRGKRTPAYSKAFWKSLHDWFILSYA